MLCLTLHVQYARMSPYRIYGRCRLSAADMLGFEVWFVKWCAVIMAAFVLVFCAVIVGALKFFNFQRR